MRYLIFFLTFFYTTHMQSQHIIPDSISSEIETALSYYPELEDVPLIFRFKKKMGKSTMQARPQFKSFFKNRSEMVYEVIINEHFQLNDQIFSTKDVPSDVLIGWIGHELGHVIDYTGRSKWNLTVFGIKYLFVNKHIKEAERAADTYAVEHGMEAFILKTKDYILNNADISDKYKKRIRKYYLSPQQIIEIVNERDGILPEPSEQDN